MPASKIPGKVRRQYRSQPRGEAGQAVRHFRQFRVTPTSFDEATRTVDAILSTEAPVPMPDWARGEMIPEVLLMGAMRMPTEGEMPLVDTHSMKSIRNVLGSCRQLRTVDGRLEGKLDFCDDDDGKMAMGKVKGGHVKSLSIGYEIRAKTFIPAGTTAMVLGREFAGPVNIATDWEPFEGSLCPVGADRDAKIREQPAQETITGNNSASRAEHFTGGSFRMNPKLLKILFQRGLASGSTSVEAIAFLNALSEAERAAGSTSVEALAFLNALSEAERAAILAEAEKPEPEPVKPTMTDEEKQRAIQEGIAIESTRQREIRKMCQIPGCEDLAEALIGDPKMTIEAAQRQLLEHLQASRPAVGGIRMAVGEDEKDKFTRAALDGIAQRVGIIIEKPAPGANEIRSMSLLRLAEECLIRANRQHRFSDPSELVARAMTSSDFPGILANSANKVLQREYLEAEETWRLWCEIGQGRDFKNMTRPQLSEADDLALVNENGEYEEKAFLEFAPSFAIQTYAAFCKLTRRIVLDDDLDAFMRVPIAFARAAQRRIGDLAYAPIIANSAINSTGTSLALFHANHANLMNPALDLGVPGLTEMRRMLRVQAGRNGKTLGLRLKHLLVPAALETNAELLATSLSYPALGAGPVDNPIRKWNLQVVPEHRLDANSTTAYYGVADYRDVGTVEVAFLNGVQTPVLLQSEGNNPDIRLFHVRIDVGVGLRDHRGMVMSAGQ